MKRPVLYPGACGPDFQPILGLFYPSQAVPGMKSHGRSGQCGFGVGVGGALEPECKGVKGSGRLIGVGGSLSLSKSAAEQGWEGD